MPRILATTIVVAACAVALAGCGGSSGPTDSSASADTAVTTTANSTLSTVVSTSSARTALSPTQRASEFQRLARHAGRVITRFGAQASAAELATLTPSVQGYIDAVAAHDYAKACTFVLATRAKPEGGKSCPEVLAFDVQRAVRRGEHENFADLVVKAARLSAAQDAGYALLGKRESPTPEAFLTVRREGGQWKPAQFAPFPFAAPSSG